MPLCCLFFALGSILRVCFVLDREAVYLCVRVCLSVTVRDHMVAKECFVSVGFNQLSLIACG